MKEKTKRCEVCDAIFTPWRGNKGRFCSKACKGVESRMTPDRFWMRVDKRGPNDCWEWTGGKDGFGYGVCGGRATHRRAYELANGAIPKGLSVCHACDNPSCVNPAHLWLGSPSDNTADMLKKGRHWVRRGEGQGANILGELQVQRIKILGGAIPYRRLAALMGVGQGAVQGVMQGRSWSWLDTKQALA